MYGGYGDGPGYGGWGNGYGGGHDDWESRSGEQTGWTPPTPPRDSGGGILLVIAAVIVVTIVVIVVAVTIGVASDHNKAKWEADPIHDSAACAIFTPQDYSHTLGQWPTSVVPESNPMDDPLDLSGPDNKCSYYQNDASTPKVTVVLRCGETAHMDRNTTTYANAMTPRGELVEVSVDGGAHLQSTVLHRAYEAELSKHLCPYGRQYPS